MLVRGVFLAPMRVLLLSVVAAALVPSNIMVTPSFEIARRELALGRHHQREKRLANSPPQMQMPYAENPYNNYQPAMGGAYEPESQQSKL